MKALLKDINACTLCKGHLPFAPRPVLAVNPASKILIIGQAPGIKVQQSGIPWNDKSGEELRSWLGVTKEQFYNTDLFSIVPMGFCYPGKGKSGDLPPRPECAQHWHKKVLSGLKDIQLTLLVGSYAQNYYLGEKAKPTLTATVKYFGAYLPEYFPLVHPSPRNAIWQRKNPWFKQEVVPVLREIVNGLINPKITF